MSVRSPDWGDYLALMSELRYLWRGFSPQEFFLTDRGRLQNCTPLARGTCINSCLSCKWPPCSPPSLLFLFLSLLSLSPSLSLPLSLPSLFVLTFSLSWEREGEANFETDTKRELSRAGPSSSSRVMRDFRVSWSGARLGRVAKRGLALSSSPSNVHITIRVEDGTHGVFWHERHVVDIPRGGEPNLGVLYYNIILFYWHSTIVIWYTTSLSVISNISPWSHPESKVHEEEKPIFILLHRVTEQSLEQKGLTNWKCQTRQLHLCPWMNVNITFLI